VLAPGRQTISEKAWFGHAKHSNFGGQRDTEDCTSLHDRLPLKGICSGSPDLREFWEISDRDMFAMEV